MSEFTMITLRDGAQVRALVAGDGPPLLLLGNMVSWEFWDSQIPFFAQRYRVIAPAYRSDPIKGMRSLDALAADVPDLLHALGYERALLMGHSIGSMVLAQVLATQPEVATAVVLANGFLQLRLLPRSLHRWLHALQPRLVPVIRALYPRLPYVARQLGSYWLLWGMQIIFLHREPASEKRKLFFAYTDTSDSSMLMRLSAALEYHAPPDLSRAQVPVLVLSSSEDHWMSPEEPRRLTELLPQGEQHVLQGIGHMAPMIVPDEFNRVVLQFLERAAAPHAERVL